MQVFNYQGPASYMLLLDWLFPFCGLSLMRVQTGWGWYPGESRSLVLRVDFGHPKQAEGNTSSHTHPSGSEKAAQMKVTHHSMSLGGQGTPLAPVSRDTHHC